MTEKTYEQIKMAYGFFLLERGLTFKQTEEAVSDENVIEHLDQLYFDNEYPYQKGTEKDVVWDMKKFFDYVNDAEYGGIMENVADLLNDDE